MTAEGSAAWDSHATTYDALFAPLTGYIARAMLRMIERRIPPRGTLLDVACGTGALALPAIDRAMRERATSGASGVVVATDYSRGMLALTERAAVERGASADVYRCEVQDGQALTYADASFDVVASCFGIFLFEDRRAGWREAARVLAPGGTFVTSVWQGPRSNAMLRTQMAPIVANLPERLRSNKPGGWMEVADAGALVSEIESVGAWSDVRCFGFQASIAFDDFAAPWGAMQNNPVMGALLRQCTPDELEAIRRGVYAAFAEVAGGEDQPLVLDSACNIVVATRR